MAPPSKKRKEREQEVEDALLASQDVARARARHDSDIFVIDNAATVSAKIRERRGKRARQKLQKVAAVESKVDALLVDRMVDKLKRKKATIQVDDDLEEDVWGDDDDDDDKEARRDPKTKVPEVLPGQSYNPKIEDHQAVVATAVKVETIRVNKADADEAWFAHRASLSSSSSAPPGENDDDDDKKMEEEEVADDPSSPSSPSSPRTVLKPSEKLTKAQRNRAKRRRAQEAQAVKAKALKDQRVALTDIKKISKALDREAGDHKKRRAIRAQPLPPDLPLHPPAVALSDDLLDSDGTLRKSKALQSPVDLLRGFNDSDLVKHHQAPKKRTLIECKPPPRRKYRGAKLLARYRRPWLPV